MSQWGSTKWHDGYQRYYREYLDQDGTVQYEWLPSNDTGTTQTQTQTQRHESVPRHYGNLNTAFGNLSMTGGTATGEDTSSPVYSTSQAAGYASSGQHGTQGHGGYDSFASGDDYGSQQQQHTRPSHDHRSYSGKGKGKASEDDDEYSGTSSAQYAPQGSHAGYSAASQTTEEEDEEGPEYQAAIRESRDQYYATTPYTETSASSSAYAPPDDDANYYNQYAAPSTSGGMYNPAASGQTYTRYDEIPPSGPYGTRDDYYTEVDAAGGPATPATQPAMQNFTHLPDARVEPSSKFKVGRVFKIMWAEPRGSSANRDFTVERVADGFYYGVRRFLIIASDEGHSTCVPILTYEKRACTKMGVKASKHGIIYSGKYAPKPLKDEPKLGFSPVHMKTTDPSEKLVKESRVNYAKLVTIEHNAKVSFTGTLEGDDIKLIQYAVNHCWEKKQHDSSKKYPR